MQMYYLFLRDLLLPVCVRVNNPIADKELSADLKIRCKDNATKCYILSHAQKK